MSSLNTICLAPQPRGHSRSTELRVPRIPAGLKVAVGAQAMTNRETSIWDYKFELAQLQRWCCWCAAFARWFKLVGSVVARPCVLVDLVR